MRDLCLQVVCAALVLVASLSASSAAAQAAAESQTAANAPSSVSSPAGVPLPPGYVIGPEDVLSVIYWRERDWSADVVVRPDGRISLPVLNDVQAAGLTPEQLAVSVEQLAARFIVGADATVIVREIRSRKVFVIGEVGKPGSYPLASDRTVLQILAEAGGLLEHAKKDDIVIIRNESGRDRRFKFNYNDVLKGKKPEQNIKLQSGDTVLVR